MQKKHGNNMNKTRISRLFSQMFRRWDMHLDLDCPIIKLLFYIKMDGIKKQQDI